MTKNTLTLSTVCLLIFALGGFVLMGSLGAKSGSHAAAEDSARTAPIGDVGPAQIDGRIAEGEYARFVHDEASGITLYWTVVADRLYLAVDSPGAGWVAVGVAPDGPIMSNADILMGYVLDGEAIVEDHFAYSAAAHKPDIELGGSDSLLAFAGSEGEGGTVLEIERLLDTGDEFDKPFVAGEVTVQLAYSDTDDWKSYHSQRGTIAVNFLDGAVVEAPPALMNTNPAAGAAEVDGRIADGEYAQAAFDDGTGMAVYWSVMGDRLYLAVSSPASGWVAVGLAPEGPIMSGADILMGYVLDGEAIVEDHFAYSAAAHKPDIELGGSDSLLAFAGSEDGGGTVLEIERLLDTGDEYDKPIVEGETFVQLAYADADDWTTYHVGRNTIVVDFFAAGGGRP